MSKYSGHEDFAGNAPVEWRDKSTSEAFTKGMSRISPPGMKPKQSRSWRFEEKTDFTASTKWHHNYDEAMFAGTEIPRQGGETKQLDLEKIFGRR